MKKFSVIIATVLVLAMTFAMTVSAGPNEIIENPAITVPNSAPVLDGVINGDEGWSTAALMNAETCGYYWKQNPLTSDGNLFFAWDNDGLYFAGRFVEGLSAVNELTGEDVTGQNEFIYSTDVDWIDVSADDPSFHYGYDGDVFGLMLDPQGMTKADVDSGAYGGLLGNGFASDYTPWYLVGLFEGDVAKMYRQKVNPGDITDSVTVKGHKTADGWEFEAKLSWDIIIADIEAISYGDVVLTKDDIIMNTGVIKAAGMYQDRFNDPEAGEVATWGRYITAPTTEVDGTPGNKGSGDLVKSCGLTLVVSNEVKGPVSDETTTAPTTDTTTAAAVGSDDTTADEADTSYEDVTDENGNVVTDASGNKVTQKVTVKTTTKEATTGTSTGGNAAQTFDIGIAVALGTLAASGIGFVATKKRK